MALALGAVAALTACSSGSPSDGAPSAAPSSAPAATPTTAPSSLAPSGTATPSPVATLAPATCLTGRWTLVRFVAVGGSTYGTGEGGDVTVTFADGRYTLAGAGQKPMVLTVGGQSGQLRVDGEARGTYALKGATATFTTRSTSGGGSLDDGSGGSRQRLTMKQVDSVIGLAGDGAVACTAQAMTITLNAIRLELGRT